MSLRTTKAELEALRDCLPTEALTNSMVFDLVHDALEAHRIWEVLRHIEGILPMCQAIGYKYGKTDPRWNIGTGIPYYEPQVNKAIGAVRAALGMDV